MKSLVVYNKTSWILTILTTLLLVFGLIISWGEPIGMVTFISLLLIIYLPSMFFAPIFIAVDKNGIDIQSPLKTRVIDMSDVADVERYRPGIATVRICASGGFLGYWGKFRDSKVGFYTGFWGKRSECFLVTLKTGKKFLLGCRDCDEIVDFIKAHIVA